MRPPSELSKHLEETRPTALGSGERVARVFLPSDPSASQIRLPQRNPRRALARRRLGRLIETRRVVS